MNRWVLKKKLHVSWILTIGAVAFLLGVFVAKNFSFVGQTSIAFLLIAIILLISASLHRYVYFVPIIIIGGIMLGLFRGGLFLADTIYADSFINQNVNVVGVVKTDVDLEQTGKIAINLDNLVVDGRQFSGKLWVTIGSSDYSIKRGDQIVVEGVLNEGFGNYSGVINDATLKTIYSNYENDLALRLRDWFSDQLDYYIGKPESSLTAGFVMGQKQSLPVDLIEAIQIVGLTHVVVASGYNLTIIVRAVRRLLCRVSKYLSVLTSALLVVGFMSITGLSPSIVRAGLVTFLCLAAWYYGRDFHPVTILAIVAVMTLVFDPSYIWGDIGWQLSFAAFFGVMVLAPLAKNYFFGKKNIGFVKQILIESLSAQVVTAPILIATFGSVSTIAIVANMLILPLVPVVMLLSFMTVVASLLFGWLATLMAFITKQIVSYMILVIEQFSYLPWATINISLDLWGVVILYLIIVLLCLYMWRKTGISLRTSNLVK